MCFHHSFMKEGKEYFWCRPNVLIADHNKGDKVDCSRCLNDEGLWA
jgi:hypothetical protein